MIEPTPNQDEGEATFTLAIDLSELNSADTEIESKVQTVPALTKDELEDMAFIDPRVIAKLSEITEARAAGRGGRAQDLVIEQKSLVQSVKDEILKERGEYLDPELVLLQTEEKRLKRVAEIKSNLTGEENEVDLLKEFELVGPNGMLSKESIYSPLFHTFTKNAFSHYLTLVDKYNSMSEVESKLKLGLKGTGKANLDRKLAHDAVAKLVSEDLSMEFDTARKLVAKMRDEIFPGSGETSTYAMSVRRGEKLVERYGGDASRVVSEELSYIERAVADAQTYHDKYDDQR